MNRRLHALLGSLLLGVLLAPIARAQVPVDLTSIIRTTDGVRLAWTDTGPGQGYTVQVRESLTSGAWRNAVTRYRWPWLLTQWADVPRGLPAARYYRVLVEPTVAAVRGRLLGSSLRSQYKTNFVNTYFASYGMDSFIKARFGIASRPFTYETVDPFGLSITTSALLILPVGASGPLPLVSVQHGSLAQKNSAPSKSEGIDDYLWGVALASSGYAVVMPDYLGLGSSPGYQAYLHARSEATCVVDALRAGRALCASNAVSLNGQLFLTGYSQGAHVTMAAHRELEAAHAGEFTVTASAPCGGPYDLGGATIDTLLGNPNYPDPWYFPILLASYLPLYRLGNTLEELLAEPYRTSLPPLLDGAHGPLELGAAMPADPIAILRSDFQADFRGRVGNPFRQALIENNVHAWAPVAPVKMFHCGGDADVVFANAEIALKSFKDRGACCASVVDPGAPERLDHYGCFLPSLRGVLAWFETLRQ